MYMYIYTHIATKEGPHEIARANLRGVCIYIETSIYIRTYVYLHIYVCIYIYIHPLTHIKRPARNCSGKFAWEVYIYRQIYIHTYICVYVYIYIHPRTHKKTACTELIWQICVGCVYIYRNIYIHTYISIYMYIYICIYIYTHAPTKRRPARSCSGGIVTT